MPRSRDPPSTCCSLCSVPPATRDGAVSPARIYKDDDAKKQNRAYKSISKGPWYKGLQKPEQLIAIALHKRPEPLTVDEANVKIKAIVKGTDVLVDEDVGYESGAEHDEDEGVLTVEQFAQLPEKGT